jgi:hypothetical protein
MSRRDRPEARIRSVLAAPEQRVTIRPGRVVFQSRRALGDPTVLYMVRVFVDVDRDPAEVVTAYRTSTIVRYWRDER